MNRAVERWSEDIRAGDGRNATASPQVPHAERMLLDGLARILRNQASKQEWRLLALHLSRIPPPGPRPHHRRVAATILDDAAGRSNGQIFALANGDLAMLFRPSDEGQATCSTLTRLFQADVPDPSALRSLWSLAEDSAAALSWVRDRLTEPSGPAPEIEQHVSASIIAALEGLVGTAEIAGMSHRQTAVLVRPGKADRMIPLFREVGISTTLLENRIRSTGQAAADPFLFSHLASQLDRRMLAALTADLPVRGPLSGGLHVAALHVNMTLAGILSEGFSRFAQACRQARPAGLRIGVEIPYVEVFADAKAFLLARERLKLADLRFVLDGVTHQALTVTNIGALGSHLIKLNWNPLLAESGSDVRESIARLGPERVVLHRCESDAALGWGLSLGIQRFQGYFVDSMLATERLRACPHATSCTLRQCRDRGATAAPAVRQGCSNLPLLDLAVPLRALAAAS